LGVAQRPGEIGMRPGISFTLALPDSVGLDLFDCGEREVDGFFRDRRWFDPRRSVASPPTYEFRSQADAPVIGYASVAFRLVEHPHDRGEGRRKYLTIYALGIDRRFQGLPNPALPSETYARSILGILECFAEGRPECPGLSLWVRIANARALRFYERAGFVADPSGPVRRDAGSPHLTMRKFLRGRGDPP
jgi:ribosomal protein S18 acetylase RimI-like enzyme